MANYTKNSDKNKIIKFELPSCPGSEINVPTRLGFGVASDIQSASVKLQVERDENGEPNVFSTIDPTVMQRETLVRTLLDSRTHHNLTDEHNNPIIFTRRWIEDEMDESDAMWLAAKLTNEMSEDLGIESAEGEEEKPEKTPALTGKRSSTPSPEGKASA